MSQNTFEGMGPTIEDAFEAAASAAAKAWKPAGPDDMATVHFESLDALYGGIAGFTGMRAVTVSLVGRTGPNGVRTMAATGTAKLVLQLQVLPDVIYANLMPPVRRPQPHKIGLLLTVTNVGDAPYSGTSPDSGVARFAILNGRTEVWRAPEIVMPAVTTVTMPAGESKSYAASWEMDDAVKFVQADLRAVARFVPSGASAMHAIEVRPVY